MTEKPKVPKDLGLKMGSPLEVMWTAVLTNAKSALEQAEQTILIQKEIIVLAKRKVQEEQRRAKPLNKPKES